MMNANDHLNNSRLEMVETFDK